MSSIAVVAPQAARNPEFYQKKAIPVPSLRVVRKDDDSVDHFRHEDAGDRRASTPTKSGSAASSRWRPTRRRKSPARSHAMRRGSSLWSRSPQPSGLTSEFGSPLAWRYDESDGMLMCENVKVPWGKGVRARRRAIVARDIYVKTPSHCFGNHQSNVRYWSRRCGYLLGLCSRIANATGADQVPAVREKLGEMSAIEATIGGLINGQINVFEELAGGRMSASTSISCMRAWSGARRITAASCRRAADVVRRRRIPDAGGYLRAGRSRSWPSNSTPIGKTPQAELRSHARRSCSSLRGT